MPDAGFLAAAQISSIVHFLVLFLLDIGVVNKFSRYLYFNSPSIKKWLSTSVTMT